MCPATAAESMMQVMISSSREKAATGNYPEAIKTITSFIESIECNDDQVHKTFGTGLVALYCLRAKLRFEAGSQKDELELEMARNDTKKAEEALDRFCDEVGPDQRESIRTSIRNVISADEKLRNEGISAALQLTGVNRTQRTERAATIWSHGIVFLIGLALWGGEMALGYLVQWSFTSLPATGFGTGLAIAIMILFAIFFFVLVNLGCIRGWDWLSDRYSMGTYAWGIKVVVFFILPFTFIGAIPVIYWTGRGAVRWYYRERG
jgi:hypothetical protein